MSFVMRVAIAPGAALEPSTTPEIHPRPPMTAYCTSRIEPKTSNEVNCTLRLAEGEEDAAERRDAGADRERVELDADDADAERGGGAFVAPDRDHSPTGRTDPQVRHDERHDRPGRSASARHTAADARTDRGRSRRSPGCVTRIPSNPPVIDAFWKMSALKTSDNANVTIASVTPRVRMAGSATSNADRDRDERSRPRTATMNGTSKLLATRAAAHAPKPASAYWHSDNWPAYPDTTTTDAMMMPIPKVTISASA